MLYFGILSFAQIPMNFNLTDTVPLYKEVVYGKLDNGLTYYILRNNKPENRAFLQLVVNEVLFLKTMTKRTCTHVRAHGI